uniref:Uncharacterized protein n=1 Tax=Mycena chlorophos TaxID=658473 RepID=A0ABQ0KWG8_MYCCL|nr:predicted protein [Mycena chlorophos]
MRTPDASDTPPEPSTQDITLEYLADEVHRLADVRGEEAQHIAGNRPQPQLAPLAERPLSPAPPSESEAVPPISSVPAPVPGPAELVIQYLDLPPMHPPSEAGTASSVRRWPSSASTMSFLSSHYSDDDLPSPYPDSPYPSALPDIDEEPSQPLSLAAVPVIHQPTPVTPRPVCVAPFGSPSSSDSSSSSSSPTARPPPDLADLRDAINRLSNAAADHGRVLDDVQGAIQQIPIAPDYGALFGHLQNSLWALGEGQAALMDQIHPRDEQPDGCFA